MTTTLRRYYLLIIILLAAYGSYNGQLVSNHKVIFYSPKNFHAHNQTWQTVQTHNGMMYFANGDGLLQFDGAEWSLTLTALETNMLSIALDDEERIYYGAIGEVGYFKKNKDGKLEAVRIENKEYEETVAGEFYWDVHIFGGKVIFRSEHLWLVYEKGKSTVYPVEDFLIKESFTVGDYLWIQDEKYNLYKIHPDSLKYLSSSHIVPVANGSLSGLAIQGLYSYGDHSVLMTGSGMKLEVYDEVSNTIEHIDTELDGISEPGFYLNDVLALPNGGFAVSSTTHGVYVLDKFGRIVSVYNEESGLVSNNVRNMFLDREGLLWLTSDVGIYKVLFNKNYTLLTEQYKEVKGISNSILEYHDQLVVATNENVYYIKNENGHLKTFPIDGFNEQSFDLIEIHGELLCATTSGFFRLDGQKYELISSQYARALIPVGGNYLLVGGRKTLSLWKKEKRKWVLKKVIDFPDEFLHLEKDPTQEDVFWGGLYSSGAARIVVDTNLNTLIYKHFDTEVNGHDGYILPFTIQDRMIFAPKAADIYSYDEETMQFVSDTFTNQLFNEKFSSWFIKEDVKGNLYYEASGPIYFCRKNEKGYEIDSSSLSNLNVGYINDMFCSQTGEVWLVAEENIVRFDPDIQKDQRVKMSVIFKKITLNSDSVLFQGHMNDGDSLSNQELILPYSDNNISFDFVSAYHTDEDPLKYSYKLLGNDDRFSQWSTDRKAIYTNLPEGKYTLMVRCMNADGVISESNSFSFEILPPWYRTGLAYGSSGVLTLILIFSIVKLNSFRLKKSNENLKKLIDEKTQEISSNLQEISIQKDQLEERNKDIIDSINYAQRLQNAILPSNEAISKAFPKHFVLYLPKDIVAGDFYWLHSGGNKSYFAAADCTGHGVPGALVSVVCNDALNQAANEFGLGQPDLILNNVNDLVKKRFSSEDTSTGMEVRDGMDIALSSIDIETGQVSFAGANNSLWVLSKQDYQNEARVIGQEGEYFIYELKADRQAIGSSYLEKNFTRLSIQLKEGDRIYMFTDGIVDQFGGEAFGKIKKFKRKNLIRMLFETSDLSMEDQKYRIHQVFEEWRGDEEQVDDVTIIGVEL